MSHPSAAKKTPSRDSRWRRQIKQRIAHAVAGLAPRNPSSGRRGVKPTRETVPLVPMRGRGLLSLPERIRDLSTDSLYGDRTLRLPVGLPALKRRDVQHLDGKSDDHQERKAAQPRTTALRAGTRFNPSRLGGDLAQVVLETLGSHV